jgi:acetylornithine deacetylase/succinyl-diaminopimelate desuccinylase-like protein
MIQAGVKSNSIPGTCTITCDVRTLPGRDGDWVRRYLEDMSADLPWARVEIDETAMSNDSPWDHPLRDAAAIAIRRASGRDDATLMPALCAGFTDSRFMRAIGVPTYDCAPGDWRDTSPDTGVHGTNERIAVDSLVAMTRFYVATAVNYLGVAGGSSMSS